MCFIVCSIVRFIMCSIVCGFYRVDFYYGHFIVGILLYLVALLSMRINYRTNYCINYCALYHSLYCIQDLLWRFYCADYGTDDIALIIYSFVRILLYQSIMVVHSIVCSAIHSIVCGIYCGDSIVRIIMQIVQL